MVPTLDMINASLVVPFRSLLPVQNWHFVEFYSRNQQWKSSTKWYVPFRYTFWRKRIFLPSKGTDLSYPIAMLAKYVKVALFLIPKSFFFFIIKPTFLFNVLINIREFPTRQKGRQHWPKFWYPSSILNNAYSSDNPTEVRALLKWVRGSELSHTNIWIIQECCIF